MKTKEQLIQAGITEDQWINTKGDVVVQAIELGDIQYCYEYGMEIRMKVTSEPVEEEPRFWTWKVAVLSVGLDEVDEETTFSVHEDFSHYTPKVYTYRAYGELKKK